MSYRLLTPTQIDLVRRSFDSMHRRNFAEMFYRRFFELAPQTRALFLSDLDGQYLTLMNMISALVGALDSRELFQSMTTHWVCSMLVLARTGTFQSIWEGLTLVLRAAVWLRLYPRNCEPHGLRSMMRFETK